MKKVCMAVIALAAIAILAGPALAQPGMGGPPITLLTGKDTAADLKLSDDQVKKFKELEGKRPGFREMEKMKEWTDSVTKEVDALKDDQKKRLKQLQYQQRGVRNFYRTGGGGGGMRAGLNADGLKELGVSDDDKKKLEEVGTAYGKAREELGRPDPQSEEYRKKSAELSKTYLDKFVAALSADAKKKYEELSGPAFKGEWPQPMRPGTGA